MRIRRQWIAGWLMLGLLFAQIVTAAHACPLPAPLNAVALPEGQAMSADCGGMAKQADSSANVCQTHCQADQQLDAQSDAPGAAIAPSLPLVVAVPDAGIPVSADSRSLRAVSSAPPPSILFSRFLI